MFYGDSVQNTRQMFFSSWQKYCLKQPLEPLEQQLVAVIIDHPEYHDMLMASSTPHDQAYFPELGQTNPFLHMGLHLATREQIATDRPPGILQTYKKLLTKFKDNLMVEHLMMDSLAECLWQAQRSNSVPDEQHYLRELMKHL